MSNKSSRKSYVNKDGKVNKVYVRKMWNFVMDTACDSFNRDIGDDEIKKRIEQFSRMVDRIVPDKRIKDLEAEINRLRS